MALAAMRGVLAGDISMPSAGFQEAAVTIPGNLALKRISAPPECAHPVCAIE